MNRMKIAQYIALAATALSVTGLLIAWKTGSTIGETVMVIGFLTGLVSYLFGGLLTAVRMSIGIAKWGWFILPFPYDIMTFILAFFAAVMAFVFLPIIPVRKAYLESAG